MKLHPLFCLALLFGAIFSNGYATSPGSRIPIASANYHDLEIHMLDAHNGWMEANHAENSKVLRTADGGKSWLDVSPTYLTNKNWDCQFPNPQTAWISYDDGMTRLLLTTNGGQSWAPWSPLGNFDNSMHNYFLRTDNCRFFDPANGLATMLDCGTCQAYYNFFETHDGGMTWNFAQIKAPEANSSDHLPGEFHLGDCDGSAISYYPPNTILIAEGDLMDETPKGVVRLNLSLDAGHSWRNLSLPLPDKYRGGLVSCSQPYFFDRKNAVLPVEIRKWDNADNTGIHFTYRDSIFYTTTDGGVTWTRTSNVLNSTNLNAYDFAAPSALFIQRETTLLASRDHAKSWQILKPALTNTQRILQTDFTDARHGWLVIFDADALLSENNFLCRTTDGGSTWTRLALKISR